MSLQGTLGSWDHGIFGGGVMNDEPTRGLLDEKDKSNERKLDYRVTDNEVEKHRMTCEVEIERIQSLKHIQEYCLLGTWLASIASMIVIVLLFGASIFFDESQFIEGWHILGVAAILFLCVTVYGAYIFQAGIKIAIEQKRVNLAVNQQREQSPTQPVEQGH